MDNDVLEEKLRHLHPESFAWAQACCHYRRDEAEDVLQTVYLKIIDGTAHFEGRSSLKTWLFSVIRITARERHRRNLRERVGLERLAFYRPAIVNRSAFLDTQRDPGDVRTALRALPMRQREALELVFYHELSIEESAAVMRVSIGTARTHYQRGKQALRKKLHFDNRR